MSAENTLKPLTANSGDRPRSSVREWTDFIVTLVVMVFFIRVTTVEAFRIPTGSMEDTLLVGDFLLVNKFVYGVRTPDWLGVPFTKIGFSIPSYKFSGPRSVKTGDIVVFRYPRNPDLNYIKRCIAGPGQTIEIRQRQVYVDGELFENPPFSKHTREMAPPGIAERGMYGQPPGIPWNRDNFGPLQIPPGSYFMMGDNRDNSEDSRFWGFVPEENIVGQALIIYFSYNKYVDIRHWYDIVRWGRIGSMIH
jgi:signal peptidase I